MRRTRQLSRLRVKNGRIKTETFDGTLDELYADYERYRRLAELAQHVTSNASIDFILETILDRLNQYCGSERSLILLFDQSGEPVFEKGRNLLKLDIDEPGFEVSWSIITQVKKSKKPIYLKNALERDEYKNAKSVMRLKILSVICTPIIYENRVIGIFYADNRQLDGIFSKSDCELVNQAVQFLSGHVFSLLTTIELQNNLKHLKEQMSNGHKYPEIFGNNAKLQDILNLVDQVANTTATVLIQGASGTGKELIARALHRNSSRVDRRFISLNCGALPETLLESELFGHVKGSFTGAVKDKKGWFESADGGTIFFDEISEMSPALQVKLLRILQTGEFSPVGSDDIKKCDVRVVAATNVDLKALVDKGGFRADLYYRLNIINLQLPLLKERRDDILLLAAHFIEKHGAAVNKSNLKLDPRAQQILLAYDFPGNVRELENAMQRAVVLCQDEIITAADLPESLRNIRPATLFMTGTFADEKAKVVAAFEKEYITNALIKSEGVVAKAARFSGMNGKNFYQKMEKYHISAVRFKKG